MSTSLEKPSASHDPEAGIAGRRPTIDHTKLQPVRLRSSIVGRERLLGLRPDPEDASVVRVVAPAGYGKTTLLATWTEQDPAPVMWVTLDRHDDDPQRLAAHVAAAILEADPDADGLAEAMASPAPTIWSTLMPRITAALGQLGLFSLVIDDAHTVTAPESLDALDWLAVHVPDGAQLVVAGRTEVGLNAARLRLEGKLADRASRDLAFDDDEAHELLLDAGATADRDAAASLNRVCGGWVSGLLLSALATSHEDSPSEVPGSPGASLDEYIRREVVGGLAPDEQRFALQASVLRLLSGPLCDAALETTGSSRLLARLCESDAFTVRLADGWYRCHDMLRESLAARLEREDPDLVARVRSRAAGWHALYGSPAAAVEYARESGDERLTARLMGSLIMGEYSSGRTATVNSWLDWAETSGLIAMEPLLALAGVVPPALAGEPERSERIASVMLHARHDLEDPEEQTRAEASRALIDAWQCRSGCEVMLKDAARAAELLGVKSVWHKSALSALAIAQSMNGLDAESDATWLGVFEDDGPARADVNARSGAAVMLARRALDRHDLAVARSWLDRSRTLRTAAGITGQGLQALHDAVEARLTLVASSDPAEARRLLAHTQMTRSLVSWAMPALALPVRSELIKVYLGLAEPTAARVLVREAFDILRHRPGLGTFETEARELRDRLATQSESAAGPSTLSGAELRMLPWLATHLSFREIGERIYLSANTVKTEALSVYRKLGVSSRSQAVEAAVDAGLLDPAALPSILQWTSRNDRDTGSTGSTQA